MRANKTYTYNERDQLERITDPANDLQIDYAYDDNGNREQRIVRQNGVVTSQVDYTFDARDRLIQAQPNAPNEAIVQYQYDADDRRIARIEIPRVNGTPQPSIVTEYVFDNSTLLHEADPAQITATYRGSAVLDRHIDHATNTVRHYQLDALRTPVAMTDAAGNTVTATTFDAWGNPTQQTAAGATTIPWSVPQYNPRTTGQAALLNNDGQSIGFTGYGKDSTTGLYYANARWYDPLVGSFNAMDPAAGIAAKPVTFHRYLYANGNPTYYVDRDGRCGVAAYIGINYGTCDFADAVLLGVNQNSIEGKIAIERYRQAQAKEILRQGADAVLAGAKLFGDFAVSGRESLTGEDLGAGDEIGAAIQGTLDYFGNLPVNVINGLAELNAEMGAAREQQDPERMGRATARLSSRRSPQLRQQRVD
ncbi:MAG: RHS domain-containing protein [Xanthomonadales bacterium]|nr:RHS domain-containing protein [Xanthomonadales bacterium]